MDGKSEAMNSIFPRRTDTPPDYPENTNVKPVAEIEGALRDTVRRDVKPSSAREAPDTAANVNSLVNRATSLSELRSVIQELQRLHDFMQTEGARLEQEISDYARLSKSTTSSTRLIADSVLHWKKPPAKET
jgi:hypothetical protein